MICLMRIYTKRGDKGQTSLFGGSPVSKADPRLEAYGTLDELNAVIGMARSYLGNSNSKQLADLDQTLQSTQNYLFTVGSHLAVGDESMRAKIPALEAGQTVNLENLIDQMEESLEPLKNFILPGGTLIASQLHVARTVARRAERAVVALGNQVDANIIVYLNRLSDFLFVAARYANFIEGEVDIPWEKN